MDEITVLKSIAEEMAALPGHLGLYYKNLETGLEFSVGGEESYLAASVIKLPIYLHVLQCIHEGTLSREERIPVEEADKMPGCGALKLFAGEQSVDIDTLCRLMIDLSDNTATNLLICRCSIPAINARMRSWGLTQTTLRRLLFDSEAAARGLENTVSPKEMGLLLESLYRGTFLTPELSQEAMDVLLAQQICHKLDGKLQGEYPIAHKTGEDTDLSNDVGLIFAPQPFLLCCTGHDTPRYPWEDLIRRRAYDLAHCQGASGGEV